MIKEYIIEKGLLLISLISIFTIILIIIFIIIEAKPAIEEYGFLNMLLGSKWSADEKQFGVLPMIIGSLYITALALAIAIPLSISTAIFTEEIASKKVKQIFKPIIQTLAGIPSVIYGFFGLMVISPIIKQYMPSNGFSILTASIILAIMILPTIISISQDAIKNVNPELKEASIGLGSNWNQTIKNIVLPNALPGIITAIILGLGRAIGETLAVMMLAGNVSNIPTSIFQPARTLTSNIALEMGYATGIHYNALFSTALILLTIIIILMIISNQITHKCGVLK